MISMVGKSSYEKYLGFLYVYMESFACEINLNKL